MLIGSRSLRTGLSLACVLAFTTSAIHAQTDSSEKKQLPADERAFKVARASIDPEERLNAMRSFINSYPKSSRVGRAQSDILKILIDTYPSHGKELDAQIKLRLKKADDVQSRVDTEVLIAYLLAEAGATGIELPRAESLAKDAVKHLSEATFDKATVAQYAKYKEPPPKPEELHKQFANNRAEALAVLADVYLREGKQALASPLVAEAYALDPLVDDVNTERGRLALLNHDDALTIESFERAQLLGILKAEDRETMMRLYRKSHNDGEDGFMAEMDDRYSQLFPAPFTPTKPKEILHGHTVLLELFTGSACPPCVGADLAVDGLLQAYPRSEVVALAFDQHIPEPDPLTSPDSVARADFYDVAHTPNFLIDGEMQSLYGGGRQNSQELYGQLTKLIEAEASRANGVEVRLSANAAAGGLVHASAIVTMPSNADITKALAATPVSTATSSGEPEASSSTKAAETATPNLIVNFALVEDDIRYSGENGVRFHRMVVRSLAKPANSGFPVAAGSTATLEASFDPAAISRSLVTYLDGYEEKNEKFGKIKFISKDMTMRPDHLAIAVWVQDVASHRVLATALVLLGEHEQVTK